MSSPDHTHPCRRCGNIYFCDGEWVPSENADGARIAVCYFYHLEQVNLCGACERQRAGRDVPDMLARMMAHPHFGAIRRFNDGDWLVVFDESAQGRAWRGVSLADAVAKWSAQYEAAEVA
jgi:hypothetical protein